jgi:beta-phosphoglucomutase-like phosphatase (HAD superfamily)
VKAVDAVLFEPAGILVDERGDMYEDVAPALAELEALGVKMIAVTSLSESELTKAVAGAALSADRVICLTDSEEGLRAARAAGVHPVLMMNDPDEAMRLTSLNPAGGIVSLHELADFVRFVVAGASNVRYGNEQEDR